MSSYTDLLNQITATQNQYQQQMAAMPSYQQTLETNRARLGMPAMEESLNALNKRVIETENLINGLEGNVNARIQGQGIAEEQRQRMYAVERKPLANQMASLGSAQKTVSGNLQNAQSQLEQALKVSEMERSRLQDQYNIAIEGLKTRLAATPEPSSGGGRSSGGSGGGGTGKLTSKDYDILDENGNTVRVRDYFDSKGNFVKRENLGTKKQGTGGSIEDEFGGTTKTGLPNLIAKLSYGSLKKVLPK